MREAVQKDSAYQDTTYQDTLRGGVSQVRFKADTIIFYTDTKDVLLLHNGEVSYGDITVYSDSIRFSTQRRMLSAYKGARLRSSSDSLIGDVLHYAVQTQKGVMEEGRTQIEKGYFSGQGIWLVEENTIHITNGYYTTCEHYPPHYDFYGSELKILLNDMVITRPIILRVRRIPVLAAPFWYLPIGNKRKSGLMPFKFGHSDEDGWFAKMLRYYWVPNDYSDVLFSIDIMTRKGFRPGGYFNWRYGPRGAEYASGSFNLNYINEIDTRKQRWRLGLNNTSYIPDGTRLTADINFQSDQRYILDYIEDEDSLTKLLDQRTRSDVSISRNLLGRPTAISASRTDDLTTGSYTMTLPVFNFSWPTATLWDFFTVNFGSFGVNNQYRHDVTQIIDTLGDTLETIEDFRTTRFSQPLTLSWSYNLLGAYTFGQSWGASQDFTWTSDSLIRDASYFLSNSFGTELSRIFGIYILGMNGMLHSVRPTITHTITPAKGTIHPWVVYPRFDTTLASHRVNLNIAQSLQAKFRARGDTTRFRKQDLLTLSTGIGYNLLTDSLTPATATIYLPSGLPVQANVNMSYNIYTDSFSIRTNASASLDKLLFPLFGLRERGVVEEDTIPWDSLGIERGDTAAFDSIVRLQPPDSMVRSEDSLYRPYEKKKTFLERFSKSKLSLENSWGIRSDSLGGVGKSDHMVSARTQLFLPFEIELNLSVATNLSNPKERWQDYIASYNLSLVKGLHCWEAVFEVTPQDAFGWGLDNLEWNLYVRIKELPDIQFGKGMLRRLGE
ncbi:MAG: putative LPS assembly protein LptD [candidate division WOR-3 bacterium]|nr:putative LPS assembly protein LptD [candidate division WOR-3 bacterium]